ncbi:neurogenic protein mastermind [Drosophila albomicans]|uniref:Neurogenic protein mastermind n=1 Tax=Drosophila albomicans TaxID=7291 RepID=A0A6P8WY51_DROAB|nr:neurogenic protein mastermind [Drosophila albomicans]
MNMNYYQMPYESDYSDDGTNKMGGMAQTFGQTQRPSSMPMMSMPTAPGMNLNQMQMPIGSMPQMSQMPMSSMTAMSYPMPGQPIMQPQQMGMMPSMAQGGGHQGSHMTMSPLSMPTMSQIPPGAVTPLTSTTMMPVMGGIDGAGMNVVVPDLQPLSSMAQMGTNNQMSPMSPMPQIPQMQQQQQHGGRLTGGSSAGTANWMSYGNAANGSQMMPGNMWNYTQNYPNMQSSVPQQQQQQPQQHRMKSQYDYATNSSSYREARNGLNSPSMHDSMRLSRNGNDGKKVPHWR